MFRGLPSSVSLLCANCTFNRYRELILACVPVTERNPKNDPDFPYLIKTVYSEFNSGAWLVNRGDYNGTSPDPSCNTS